MKKYLILTLFVIAGYVAAFAGDDIKLVKGSIAALKNGGTGCVALDMTDTKFDNKKPLRNDERFRNVDDQLPECKSEFIREFNENSKKFQLIENETDAQYEFLVTITNLDVFINVMSFKGGIGVKLWGSIKINDKASGNCIAEYEIDEESNSGMTYQIALEEGFEGIAKYLAKRVNKGK